MQKDHAEPTLYANTHTLRGGQHIVNGECGMKEENGERIEYICLYAQLASREQTHTDTRT